MQLKSRQFIFYLELIISAQALFTTACIKLKLWSIASMKPSPLVKYRYQQVYV